MSVKTHKSAKTVPQSSVLLAFLSLGSGWFQPPGVDRLRVEQVKVVLGQSAHISCRPLWLVQRGQGRGRGGRKMHLHRSQTLQARDIRDRLRDRLLSLRGSQRLDLRQWSRVLYKGVLGNVRLRFRGKCVLFPPKGVLTEGAANSTHLGHKLANHHTTSRLFVRRVEVALLV